MIPSRGSKPWLYLYSLLPQPSCKVRRSYFSYASIFNRRPTYHNLMPPSLKISIIASRTISKKVMIVRKIGPLRLPFRVSCNSAGMSRILYLRTRISLCIVKMLMLRLPWITQSMWWKLRRVSRESHLVEKWICATAETLGLVNTHSWEWSNQLILIEFLVYGQEKYLTWS